MHAKVETTDFEAGLTLTISSRRREGCSMSKLKGGDWAELMHEDSNSREVH